MQCVYERVSCAGCYDIHILSTYNFIWVQTTAYEANRRVYLLKRLILRVDMGKLSPEMNIAILNEFDRCHSYKKTADKLGIDERTVKRVISNRHSDPLSTNQKIAVKTINNPEANIEMNKTIYRELRRSKKPDEIIEKHGFPSGYVQAEYEQFNKNRNTDMIDFQKRYIDGIEAYVRLELPVLRPYIDTFYGRGYLTNDELLELVYGLSEGSPDDSQLASTKTRSSTGRLFELYS